MAEVKNSEEKDFLIDYKYCNNAYMVADERCIEVAWMLQNIKNLKMTKSRCLMWDVPEAAI